MQNIVNVIYDMLFKKSFEIYKHIKKKISSPEIFLSDKCLSRQAFYATRIFNKKIGQSL